MYHLLSEYYSNRDLSAWADRIAWAVEESLLENVKVVFVPLTDMLGRAYMDASFQNIIQLSEHCPIEMLEFCVWHECAHFWLGHVASPCAEEPDDHSLMDDLAEVKNATDREILYKFVEKQECAANVKALELQAQFKKRYGTSLIDIILPLAH